MLLGARCRRSGASTEAEVGRDSPRASPFVKHGDERPAGRVQLAEAPRQARLRARARGRQGGREGGGARPPHTSARSAHCVLLVCPARGRPRRPARKARRRGGPPKLRLAHEADAPPPPSLWRRRPAKGETRGAHQDVASEQEGRDLLVHVAARQHVAVAHARQGHAHPVAAGCRQRVRRFGTVRCPSRRRGPPSFLPRLLPPTKAKNATARAVAAPRSLG